MAFNLRSRSSNKDYGSDKDSVAPVKTVGLGESSGPDDLASLNISIPLRDPCAPIDRPPILRLLADENPQISL